MSKTEGDPFDNIVASIGMRVGHVPMGGRPVVVNSSLGEEFREEMFRIQDDVVPPLAIGEEGLDQQTVYQLDSTLERHLQRGGFAIELNEWVVVEGVGLYLAGVGTLEERLGVHVLTEGERLLGKLQGVAYNAYPFVPGITELPLDHDEAIEVLSKEGLVMTLGSTMLCGTEGYGLAQEGFPYAFIPLPEDSLVVYRADPIE